VGEDPFRLTARAWIAVGRVPHGGAGMAGGLTDT
jgi:hypothetical protein